MLLSQTYQDWKAYLIDDFSTDGSKDKLTELTRYDSRFFLLSNSFSSDLHGPGSARNTGIQASVSHLIAFCDIDDLWHPDKLVNQVKFHQAYRLDLSVTSYARFDSRSPNYIKTIRRPPPALRYNALLLRNCIPFSSVLASRHIFSKRAFRSIKHEDYEFWLYIFKSFPALRYGRLDQVLMFYREHPGSLSANKSLMPVWVFTVYRSAGFDKPTSFLLVLLWSASQVIDLLCEISAGFKLARPRNTLLKCLAPIPPSMPPSE